MIINFPDSLYYNSFKKPFSKIPKGLKLAGAQTVP
jgi:hypothetical protein